MKRCYQCGADALELNAESRCLACVTKSRDELHVALTALEGRNAELESYRQKQQDKHTAQVNHLQGEINRLRGELGIARAAAEQLPGAWHASDLGGGETDQGAKCDE